MTAASPFTTTAEGGLSPLTGPPLNRLAGSIGARLTGVTGFPLRGKLTWLAGALLTAFHPLIRSARSNVMTSPGAGSTGFTSTGLNRSTRLSWRAEGGSTHALMKALMFWAWAWFWIY